MIMVYLLLSELGWRCAGVLRAVGLKKTAPQRVLLQGRFRGFPLNPRYSKALYLRVPIK